SAVQFEKMKTDICRALFGREIALLRVTCTRTAQQIPFDWSQHWASLAVCLEQTPCSRAQPSDKSPGYPCRIGLLTRNKEVDASRGAWFPNDPLAKRVVWRPL